MNKQKVKNDNEKEEEKKLICTFVLSYDEKKRENLFNFISFLCGGTYFLSFILPSFPLH